MRPSPPRCWGLNGAYTQCASQTACHVPISLALSPPRIRRRGLSGSNPGWSANTPDSSARTRGSLGCNPGSTANTRGSSHRKLGSLKRGCPFAASYLKNPTPTTGECRWDRRSRTCRRHRSRCCSKCNTCHRSSHFHSLLPLPLPLTAAVHLALLRARPHTLP